MTNETSLPPENDNKENSFSILCNWWRDWWKGLLVFSLMWCFMPEAVYNRSLTPVDAVVVDVVNKNKHDYEVKFEYYENYRELPEKQIKSATFLFSWYCVKPKFKAGQKVKLFMEPSGQVVFGKYMDGDFVNFVCYLVVSLAAMSLIIPLVRRSIKSSSKTKKIAKT